MGVKGVKRVWPDLDAEIRRTRAGLRAARGDVLELTEREQPCSAAGSSARGPRRS